MEFGKHPCDRYFSGFWDEDQETVIEKPHYYGCDDCGIDYDLSKIDGLTCLDCGNVLTDSGIEIEC
ncbi:hypothetical protein EP331_00025 [bacterium]|nr:MAG: hypothetical protein EP331_00025 [bacterium]